MKTIEFRNYIIPPRKERVPLEFRAYLFNYRRTNKKMNESFQKAYKNFNEQLSALQTKSTTISPSSSYLSSLIKF